MIIVDSKNKLELKIDDLQGLYFYPLLFYTYLEVWNYLGFSYESHFLEHTTLKL